MKSFSFKAFVLAFIFVAGSANAYYGEENVNKVCTNVDDLCTMVSDHYNYIIDNIDSKLRAKGYAKTEEKFDKIASLLDNRYVILTLSVAATAVYKTYKYFTKPAVDATEEGENTEPYETTTEVAP